MHPGFDPLRPWHVTAILGQEWSGSDFGLQVLEGMTDTSVFVKDSRYRFIYGNGSFLTFMGVNGLEGLLFKTDLDFSPGYLINKYRRDDDTVLSTGVALPGIIELVRSSGRRYEWVETTKLPVKDASGEVIGLAGIIRQLSAVQANLDSLEELTPATQAMLENYGRNLTLSKLASMTSLSVSQFCKRFKATFGITPHAYLVDLRLDRACELLRDTDMPVATIAKECGFYDQSHLTNLLSRHREITPRQYRQRCRDTRVRLPLCDPQRPAERLGQRRRRPGPTNRSPRWHKSTISALNSGVNKRRRPASSACSP